MSQQFRVAKCPHCTGKYELIPPADPSYKIPREKPTGDDYILLPYECDDEGHVIKIYWEQEAFVMATSEYRSEALRNEDRASRSYLGKTAGNVTRA